MLKKFIEQAKEYEIIYADPGWGFKNKRTGGSMTSGAANHYTVTSHIENICKLPVPDIAAENCTLFMWWVASQPREALQIVEGWGFTLKTMTGFVWDKETKHGKDHFGMGYYTRAGTECCLIATKGKPKVYSHSVRSKVRAKVGKHSEKPAVVRDKIVQLSGDLPRIELFARKRVDGWDAWGNEV